MAKRMTAEEYTAWAEKMDKISEVLEKKCGFRPKEMREIKVNSWGNHHWEVMDRAGNYLNVRIDAADWEAAELDL